MKIERTKKRMKERRRRKMILDKRKPPPQTLRYCRSCKTNRRFEYIRSIGHSRCKTCGSYLSRRPK